MLAKRNLELELETTLHEAKSSSGKMEKFVEPNKQLSRFVKFKLCQSQKPYGKFTTCLP